MTANTQLQVIGRISASVRRELEERTRTHVGLKTVLDWCLGQQPPILDTEVVTQDEFTHDLIVPVGEGVYLVYDST